MKVNYSEAALNQIKKVFGPMDATDGPNWEVFSVADRALAAYKQVANLDKQIGDATALIGRLQKQLIEAKKEIS